MGTRLKDSVSAKFVLRSHYKTYTAAPNEQISCSIFEVYSPVYSAHYNALLTLYNMTSCKKIVWTSLYSQDYLVSGLWASKYNI